MAEDFEVKKDDLEEVVKDNNCAEKEDGDCKYHWSTIFISAGIVLSLIAVGGYMFIKSPKSAALKNYILENYVEPDLNDDVAQEQAVNIDPEEMTRKHSLYEDKGIKNLEEAKKEQEKSFSKERKTGKDKNRRNGK